MNNEYVILSMEAGRVFSPSAPVDEKDLFAGRTKQLEQVIDAVYQRGQHAIIFGERGVGKTSLSNVLSQFFSSLGQHIYSVRVNCDASDNFSSIWKKALNSIPLNPSAEDDKKSLPVEKSFASYLSGDATPEAIKRILGDLSLIIKPVVIIDEFDRLVKKDDTALFADTIKTLSDYSVEATVIIVGVADSVDDLIKEHASTERAMVQIPMPRMSPIELMQIVTNGINRLGMEIDDKALFNITVLSQGLPHYTHLLGLHSAREALKNNSMEVRTEHITAAIQDSLSQAQQSIRNSYVKAISSPRKESLYKQVLLACALAPTDELGYFSPSDVREPMTEIMGKHYDIPSFSRHLKDFSEKDKGPILHKTGTERKLRYRFINPLMQPYVTLRGISDGLISEKYLFNRDSDE